MEDQSTNAWWTSPAFKAASSVYYLIAGLALVLLMTFAAPSFAFYPCAILLTLSAFFWKWPRQAAAFSFPFVCVFAYSLYVLKIWHWAGNASTSIGLFCIVILFFVPCSIVLIFGRIAWKSMFVAVLLVTMSFAVDRIWTNKVEIRSIEMGWTADGETPCGGDAQRDAANRPPVIVYVQAGGGYCYDAIFYEPLKVRLQQLGKSKIVVQYNVFKDFGSERGYNIRSVEGFQFNDAKQSLIQDVEGYGGNTLAPSDDRRKYGPPACPR